jgi:trans-aconitate methyltransferase
MSQSQRELRHTAAQSFIESLNQLEMQLKTSEPEAVEAKQLPDSADEPEKTTAKETTAEETAFAEAAADIEQFMQAQNTQTEV